MRADLAAMVVFLPAIGLVLKLAGLRRTYLLLQHTGAGRAPRDAVTAVAEADAIARLVGVASRHGPYRASCLRQSLLLWWLLRRRRLPAELCIGVAKPAGGVVAHAWVELDGRVLNDPASVARDYAAFPGLCNRLAPHASAR
jgi:hypothetical protein